MGEFYPLYVSEQIPNDRTVGAKWDLIEIPAKELNRNDMKRSMRIEFFEVKNVKEVETAIFVAEFDFTLDHMSNYLNKYMNVFCGRQNVGKVKIMQISVYEKK